MRIAHISDIHISSPTPASLPSLKTLRRKKTQLLNKRLAGIIAERIVRGPNVFSADVFTAALLDMREQGVDHLIISGDLTNFSYTGEFKEVLRLLSPHFPPERCSIVPGNHDAFLPETVKRRLFTQYCGAYTASDSSVIHTSVDVVGESTRYEPGFPFVKTVGHTVAIIGLNSAVAHRLPFDSGGAIDYNQYKEAKEQVLKLQTTSPWLFKIFVVHHPPRFGNGTFKDLRHDMQPTSVERCWEIFDLAGPNAMVLYGHDHEPFQGRLENRQRTLLFDPGSGTYVEGDKDHIARYNLYDFEETQNSLTEASARIWDKERSTFFTKRLEIPELMAQRSGTFSYGP